MKEEILIEFKNALKNSDLNKIDQLVKTKLINKDVYFERNTAIELAIVSNFEYVNSNKTDEDLVQKESKILDIVKYLVDGGFPVENKKLADSGYLSIECMKLAVIYRFKDLFKYLSEVCKNKYEEQSDNTSILEFVLYYETDDIIDIKNEVLSWYTSDMLRSRSSVIMENTVKLGRVTSYVELLNAGVDINAIERVGGFKGIHYALTSPYVDLIRQILFNKDLKMSKIDYKTAIKLVEVCMFEENLQLLKEYKSMCKARKASNDLARCVSKGRAKKYNSGRI